MNQQGKKRKGKSKNLGKDLNIKVGGILLASEAGEVSGPAAKLGIIVRGS